MAITRRQFIQRTGALTAGALLGPGLWSNRFVLQALAAPLVGKYLVVLFLDGGNDGLNTVVPVDNGGGTFRTDYQAARFTGSGGLRLTPTDLAATLIGSDPPSGAQLALHPGFVGLKQLYDQGQVAVIQGCGYPDYNLSHEESRVIWQTANPLGDPGYTGDGWVGRYLSQNYGPTDIPGLTVGDAVAPELRTTATSVLAVQRLRDFGFPYDYGYGDDDTAKRDAFAALCAAASGSGGPSSLVYVGDSGTSTLTASESYPGLHNHYTSNRGPFNQLYSDLDTSTARNLREIAKVIYGVETSQSNINARLFQLSNGGYDTHSDQGASATDTQHYSLHREVGDAMKVFFDDLADMGAANKVVVVVWSEFSRRIEQNDNGTDHGSQGPMFVIGGAVNGGVYGKHANINASALDGDGNTDYVQGALATNFRSTDFRDVYGTILEKWLGMNHATILSSVLPLDSGPASSYWTTANFPMGFLP